MHLMDPKYVCNESINVFKTMYYFITNVFWIHYMQLPLFCELTKRTFLVKVETGDDLEMCETRAKLL